MVIPLEIHGTWTGSVTDTARKKTYQAEITIAADSVSTLYNMAQGDKEGVLSLICSSDGILVFGETVASWSGTLLLYLDPDRDLRCIWRSSMGDSEATMSKS